MNIPKDWWEKNYKSPAVIIGHEARHRMISVLEYFGNIPIETHVIFRTDKDNQGVRKHHIPEIFLKKINKEMVSQDGMILQGPFFNEN